MSLKTLLGRKIISSKFFWSIRHLFQPSWIISYSNSNKDYLLNYIKRNKMYSILDFGCATGSLLYNLKLKDNKYNCYGIDINSIAVEFCISRFKKISKNQKSFHFEKKLNFQNVETFLENNEIKFFDLVIFDRVLYCLNSNEIDNIFSKLLTKYAQKVFIDDFQFIENKNYKSYKHRDWINILDKYNFKCILNEKTIYNEVKNANPRSLIFKNETIVGKIKK